MISRLSKPLQMKHLLTSLVLFAVLSLSAQEKGASPLNPQSLIRNPQSTRAVVVGISDYQSPQIPDLRFAHRDAGAFADWLKSPAGGSVPEDNIQLFTNEKATNYAVILALTALLDVCQPGDQVVFYFSGHGDVETKTRSNPGFLLTHDTPPNVYMAGALNLRDLQDIVGTLSERQVKMILITDACHAGKLAGNNIGGTQATAYSLQQQFANEVKIMSCQPNEFSLEGEEWGGGRGVFSYHLIDALTGLADKNEDDIVNLLEAGRYLEEIVPAATVPHPQMPVTAGDRLATLARVDAASLAALKQSKTGLATMVSSTGSKGLEDEVLARADSLTRARYHAFKTALAGDNLLENADAHFRFLIGQEALAPLHGLMRRNFAVALLDEVQQALNALLDNDPYEANNWRYNPQKYSQYPAYLARAIELLGEKHHMYASLVPKKLYFDAYNMNRNMGELVDFPEKRDSIRTTAKSLLMEAIRLEPSAAYLYHAMANLHHVAFSTQSDTFFHYAEKAIQYAPNWLLPYLDIAYEYNLAMGNTTAAGEWLQKALVIAPHAYVVLERLSWLKQWQNKTGESLALCDTMIALRPKLFNAYSTKGVTHLIRTEWKEAEEMFDKSIALDSSLGNWAWNYKIILYCRTRRFHEAEEICRRFAKNTSDESVKIWMLTSLANELADWGFPEGSEGWIRKLIDFTNFNSAPAYWSLGYLKFKEGKLDEAKQLLKKSGEIDPIHSACKDDLPAAIAAMEGKISMADSLFQSCISATEEYYNALEMFVNSTGPYFLYARFLIDQKRYSEARQQYDRCLYWEPHGWRAPYGNALLALAEKGDKREALDWLEKALDNFYPEPESIMAEQIFKKIRKTKRFKALMEKHFPDSFSK